MIQVCLIDIVIGNSIAIIGTEFGTIRYMTNTIKYE